MEEEKEEGDAICMRVTSIASRSLCSSRSFKCQCQVATDGRADGGPAKDALPCLTPLSDQECNPFRSCPFLMNRAIVQSTSSDLGRTRTTSGSARARIKSMRHCLAVDGHDVMAPYKSGSGGGEWIDAETFAETLRREGRVIDSRACVCDHPPIHIPNSGASLAQSN